MNCPTVALIDGKFRSDLEETGMGFELEVGVLGYASHQGMFTKAFCTTPEEALADPGVGARRVEVSGIDVLVPEVGAPIAPVPVGEVAPLGADGLRVARELGLDEALIERAVAEGALLPGEDA